jgi:hypothetical protein
MFEIYNQGGRSSWSFLEKRIAHFLRNSSSIRLGKMKTIVIMIAATLLTIFPIKMTYASSDELGLFDQGYEYYLLYHPDKAVESFHTFLNTYPNSSMKDAALFWLGRSLVTLKSFDAAKEVFLKLNDEIPDSPFRASLDNELKTINSQTTERIAVHQMETIQPDVQILRDEKAEAEKKLTELTVERDHLRLLLEEEKLKTQESKSRADRYESELREIFSRLAALQTDQKSDHDGLMISQDHRAEHATVPQQNNGSPQEETTGKSTSKENVTDRETRPDQKNEISRALQKEPLVARQTSSHTLELIASEETWIHVTIDDKDSRDRLLKPGTRIKLMAKNNFALRIGNAGGIRVFFNGKDLGPLGERGKVVKIKLPSFNFLNGKRESPKVL